MDSNKPLASLVIFFYNQVDYVEESVQGALSQTYENLEIILSDDCSTDGTYDKILKCIKDYHGAHTIIVNRNENNIGLVPHVNKVLFELSHGRFIFLQGGDDISLPNRVADGMDCFKKNDSIYGLTCPAVIIDKEGNETGKMGIAKEKIVSLTDADYLSSSSFMCGVGPYAIRRAILDFFGPLNDDCQTEDSCLRFRALLLGTLMASTQYNVKYRIHGNNISIGNVVFKLSSYLIANQYRKDLKKCESKLSLPLYELLQRKIDYYETNREIEKNINCTSFLPVKYYMCIKKKLLRIRYEKRFNQYLHRVQ